MNSGALNGKAIGCAFIKASTVTEHRNRTSSLRRTRKDWRIHKGMDMEKEEWRNKDKAKGVENMAHVLWMLRHGRQTSPMALTTESGEVGASSRDRVVDSWVLQ
jgi:hypothetical protein